MRASCQCGSVTATIDDGVAPFVVACHCIDCQKRSGSPFGVIAYFSSDAVTIHDEAREHTRPTDAGGTFTTGFCTTCGTTLYGRASKHSTLTLFTMGTTDDATIPLPMRWIYEQRRHGWIEMPASTPGFVRGADGARSR